MILVIANTIIGRKGNIGYRIGQVLKYSKCRYFVIARGIEGDFEGISLGWIGTLLRMINGVRRYYFPKFNSRAIDIFIFEISVYILFLYRFRNEPPKTVYLCESAPRLASYFKKKGWKIIWDVPIAPSIHVADLKRTGIGESLVFNKYLDVAEKKMIKESDGIICPSEYVYRILKKLGANESKIHIVPFGVNAKDSYSTQTFDPRRNNVVGFLGNISARKGADMLIDAWNCSELKDKGVRLILQGHLYPEIVNRKIHQSIKIIPFGDTEMFFKEIGLFMFPSLMEGSAKCIYEAISEGVPVIASEYSGPPFFDGENIRRIDELSVSGIAKILDGISLNDFKSIDPQWVESFVRKYSWRNYSILVHKVFFGVAS